MNSLLTELREYRMTEGYKKLVSQSMKRTEEGTRLKRERDYARFKLRQGKRRVNTFRETELASKYRTGVLAKQCAAAEARYTTHKLDSVAESIGWE